VIIEDGFFCSDQVETLPLQPEVFQKKIKNLFFAVQINQKKKAAIFNCRIRNAGEYEKN